MSAIARLSIDEYDRMIDSGVFENRRIELIHGQLRDMIRIYNIGETCHLCSSRRWRCPST